MKSLILISCCALALVGCTAAQKGRVETAGAAICASIPLAQAAYNTAILNHDENAVNFVMTTLNAFCPTILTAIQLVPERAPPAFVPPPIPTPERG